MFRATPTATDVEYILQVAGPGGWLADETDRTRIRLYMASYLALGLVAQYYQTGSQKYLQAAWGWLEWYAAHNDVNGVTHDYSLAQGASSQWVLTDLGADSVDSTDAYAGMFLTAAWQVWNASRDTTRMNNIAAALNAAVSSIDSTLQPDGLTWAKPSYQVKYLEDNIEALTGLRSGELLGTAISDTTLHDTAKTAGDKMALGIAFMWNEQLGTFDWAIHSDGVRITQDWTDENAQRQQVWSVAYGGIPDMATYAATIMNLYVTHYPNWDTDITNGYQTLTPWAYLRIGDTASAQTGMNNLIATRNANNSVYPYNTLAAGELLYTERMVNDMPALNIPILGGHNLLPDPALTDANSDGAADILQLYGTAFNGVSASSIAGANQQRLTVPSAGVGAVNFPMVATTAGMWYVFSIYANIVAVGTSTNLTIKIEWYDASNNLVTYGYTQVSGIQQGRYWWAMQAPSGATQAKCIVGPDPGMDCYFWGPQFEMAGAPTAFTLNP